MEFNEKRPLYLLEELASILRAENGCAWDKKQTSNSLKPYLIEEAYEVYDAIDENKPEHLKEELGDLLYQVYAHSQIAKENNQFTIDDVAQGIVTKLIRRHPHVFENEEALDAEDVINNWEKIKKKEKADRNSILEGVPKHLPALLKAYRIQQKVSRVGFDWEKVDDAVKKLDEEIDEFKDVLSLQNKDKILEESGDILFSIVNVLRLLDLNPEDALLHTINKFINRFRYIETKVREKNMDITEMDLEELDHFWEEAKYREKK